MKYMDIGKKDNMQMKIMMIKKNHKKMMILIKINQKKMKRKMKYKMTQFKKTMNKTSIKIKIMKTKKPIEKNPKHYKNKQNCCILINLSKYIIKN